MVKNLYTFAKLYGYIRYFHPSDEAYELDWERFLLYGIEKVKHITHIHDLKEQLEILFKPIAPTLQLSFSDEKIQKTELPDKTEAMKIVGWKHYGVGLQIPGYFSERVFSEDHEKILLFEEEIPPHYVVNRKINEDITVSFPLTLYHDGNRTLGSSESQLEEFDKLQLLLKEINIYDNSLSNENIRIADTVITWTIFQHFYPAFDIVQVDWDKQLINTLSSTLTDVDATDFRVSLLTMLEPLQDGHMDVRNPAHSERFFPFHLTRIANDFVVTASGLDEIQKGDILLKKNDRDIAEIIDEYENMISGSVQWKKYYSLNELLRNHTSKPAELTFDRNDEQFSVAISPRFTQEYRGDEYNRSRNFYYVDEDIFYVNLTGAVYVDQAKHYLEEMREARGIIFDMRGYPYDFNIRYLLEYIIDQPVVSHQFNVLQTIYPDQEQIRFDKIEPWELTPKEPKITGEIVFLIDSSAKSRPETILNIVDYYELGTLIGQPTAGATGTIQLMKLISGFEVMWTGMQVLVQDGSKLNIIGIEPDVFVERKMESVRDGIDDYLETAIEYLRRNN
ncbi:S41 family peptidase [Evansella sp. AB-rgal1]|uniref:S41 family peptidase n=1 Tax=Evansella sp. AB-rgal1 TaxID=3242696 RepID=UPI00359E9D93